MKNYLVNGLSTSGVFLGIYSVLFRTIEIISYAEFKGAAATASGLCAVAFVISKVSTYK